MPDEKPDDIKLTLGDGPVGHGINLYKKCPQCGGTNFEVRNYDMMWQDGDVYCIPCNFYVRGYDAG